MATKSGAKGAKIGRGSRSPSSKAYNGEKRWIKNKKKAIARNDLKVAQKKIKFEKDPVRYGQLSHQIEQLHSIVAR